MQEGESVLKEVRHLPTERTEIKIRNKKNILVALIVGAIIVVISVLILILFELDYQKRVIVAFCLILIYAIVLFFLLEPRVVHEVRHREVHHYEKPIYHEVIKEIEKPIVKVIEKPVYKEIEKPVKVEVKEQEKPKAPFVGSSETRTYHLRSCRFAGLIKPKFLKEEWDRKWFDRKGYSPCKACITREKKN